MGVLQIELNAFFLIEIRTNFQVENISSNFVFKGCTKDAILYEWLKIHFSM